MEWNSSSATNIPSATQDIPHMLWNPKTHFRDHSSDKLIRSTSSRLINIHPLENQQGFRIWQDELIYFSALKWK